jgi:prolyl-tRNA synthetase
MLDIIVSNVKDSEQLSFANDIYSALIDAGKEAIIDDRDERFGFKMSDFELIGFPYALIVGKGLKNNEVQLVDRKTLQKLTLSTDEVLQKVMELCDK